MTMLLQQHGIMGNPSGSLIPTDKTKTYSLIETFDDTRYYLNSLLHQNPKDKRIIVHTFGDGVDHVSDPAKRISYRLSTDRGLTYGAKATLYDPTDSTYQIQDPGVGMDRRGRLHILADCHTLVGTAGGTHEARYMYSDDNGVTVSSPVVIPPPATSLVTFRFYGRIIDTGGGVLLAPSHWVTEEANTTNSERWVLRSTDYGANWTWHLIEATTDYINETELLAVTSNVIFSMSRYEVPKQYVMCKSTDAGITWTRVGGFGTTITMSGSPGPCRLHKFRADTGKYYAAMYFPDKGNNRVYAMYGRLDNGVEAGIGLFNTTTVTLLTTQANDTHYGDFCHYNNNMNCRGAWPLEVGSFPFDNQMIYFENQATHYNTVAAIIDPITIYDKLGIPIFIGTYRGMVANTDNTYGVVDSSNRVTTLKSILPGPLAQNFTATAGGILLDGTGMTFDGTKALTHGTSSYWNFMHYSSAGATDLNYTMYFKLKIGVVSNPNAFYGIIGNSAGGAGNRGITLGYDDRAAVPASDRINFQISKGTVGWVIKFDNDNVITPNAFHVVCMEVDLSQASNNNKVKLYVDGVLISTTVSEYTASVINSATYAMQIGNIGNSTAGGFLVGTIKDVIIQNAIEIPTVRTNFTQALIDAV